MKIIVGVVLSMLGYVAYAQPVSLFNGKDLAGWKVYGTEKWYVKDGLLICESGPDKQYGYLATEKAYKDFELTLEFKQGADGNSGVFFRSSIEGTKITGWQAEVAPPGSDTGGIYESYGRGWLIKPDKEKERFLKFGDWNLMKVRVVGDQVTTWLNGQQMIHLIDQKIGEATGSIALQIHDGGGIKVYWRNIHLTEIKSTNMKTPFLGLRTCIYIVDDLKKAITWYSKAFQVKPYFDEPFYVGFNIAGYELGLMPDESHSSGKGESVNTYWGVDNVEREYARLISLGATEHEKPHNVGGELVVGAVKDPWGNIIGLIYNPDFKLD